MFIVSLNQYLHVIHMSRLFLLSVEFLLIGHFCPEYFSFLHRSDVILRWIPRRSVHLAWSILLPIPESLWSLIILSFSNLFFSSLEYSPFCPRQRLLLDIFLSAPFPSYSPFSFISHVVTSLSRCHYDKAEWDKLISVKWSVCPIHRRRVTLLHGRKQNPSPMIRPLSYTGWFAESHSSTNHVYLSGRQRDAFCFCLVLFLFLFPFSPPFCKWLFSILQIFTVQMLTCVWAMVVWWSLMVAISSM